MARSTLDRYHTVRHYVKEHIDYMVKRAAYDETYDEDHPGCVKNLEHLGHLRADAKRLEDLLGVKKINPLKEAKRS